MGTLTINNNLKVYAATLGFDATVSATACSNFAGFPASLYLIPSADFATATYLYAVPSESTPGLSGYYSNGTIWRYWDSVLESFTSDGVC